MNIEPHLKEITRLRKLADTFHEDNPTDLMNKIKVLAQCQTFIGRVSSVLDGDYKRIYAQRKYEQAQAHVNAKKDKAATAEIAVRELREQEAEAYESMMRWRNAMSSTTEELHAMKLKLRIDFAIDSQTPRAEG